MQFKIILYLHLISISFLNFNYFHFIPNLIKNLDFTIIFKILFTINVLLIFIVFLINFKVFLFYSKLKFGHDSINNRRV
jgi:hypothetical protein